MTKSSFVAIWFGLVVMTTNQCGQATALCIRRPEVICNHYSGPGQPFSKSSSVSASIADCLKTTNCVPRCHPFLPDDDYNNCLADEETYSFFCQEHSNEDPPKFCEDNNAEECQTSLDCVWAEGPSQLDGPFDPACATADVAPMPGLIGRGTIEVTHTCLNPTTANDACGVKTSALGYWIAVESRMNGPLRLEVEADDVDMGLALFVHNPSDHFGSLTCLAYNSDLETAVAQSMTDHDDVYSNEVVVEAVMEKVYYVFSYLRNTTGFTARDSVKGFRLSGQAHTAEAVCELECIGTMRHRDKNATSCKCKATGVDQYTKVEESLCEYCTVNNTVCFMETKETVYGNRGEWERDQRCYHATKGASNDRVCVA
mmetsp:Transcript_877/g.1749  ORF Transcript_877/g.1749 Transcript_877/m.1749 type:complete len:371 (+) Transcript_877:107-1219(+)